MGERPSAGRRLFEGASRLVELLGRFIGWSSRPLRRMWRSEGALDSYALVHMGSAAGDALVAIALADSVFFSLPVGEAKFKVALYLGLTMLPLAGAAPALVPLLDRGGYRRAISFGAAAGRGLVAVLAAPYFDTPLLFPAAFVMLVLSKVHGITKNGLTMAYTSTEESLVRANARLGRLAAVSAVLAALPGLLALKLGGAEAVLYVAAVAYTACMFATLRLPRAEIRHVEADVSRMGRLPSLATPAAGTAGLRGASGFLLFLLAFALRRSGEPTYWFGVIAAAGTAGVFLGDLVAPRLPRTLREEAVVLGSLLVAGAAALVAFEAFTLSALVLFALLAGAATEFGRLMFQSLMQASAPGWAHGRVFVRYEAAFQLAWVVGGFLAAVLPFSFRSGILAMSVFYIVTGVAFLIRPYVSRVPVDSADREAGAGRRRDTGKGIKPP